MTTSKSSTIDKELTDLITSRQDALHNVDYTPLASRHDVGGTCSTLLTSSLIRDGGAAVTSEAAAAVMEGRLTTPKLDISGLHGRRYDGDDKLAAAPTNSTTTNSSNPSQTFLPEAVLHRDGDQARLVNIVKQRQLAKAQHDYEEMSTIQWINDSFWEIWTSVVGTTTAVDTNGSVGENKIRFEKHEHYSDIVNPYRDERRSSMRQLKSDGDASAVMPNDLVHVDDVDEDDVATFKHKPIPLRILVYICKQILHILRYVVHFSLSKLIGVENVSTNATALATQSYTLQFTADDIIKCFVLLWLGIKFSFWLHRMTASVLILMVVFGFVFRQKISRSDDGSSELAPLQHQYQQQRHDQRSIPQQSDVTQQRQISTAATPAAARQLRASEVIRSEDKPQHLQAIHRLKTRFPKATHAECKRFYVCVKHKENEAAQRIESWLQWRADCGLKLTADPTIIDASSDDCREYNQNFIRHDQEIWDEAAKLAIQLENNKGASVNPNDVKLPQILCAYEPQIHTNATTDLRSNSKPPPRGKDSSRILHILPARIDIALAPAPTYSLACALYLDRRLCRSTTEKITLLCDVRGGRGWANPTPWSMLPFIQSTSSLLGKHYPERLQRFVLFPMPSAAAWIWSAAQKCLDPNTASKVVVVGEEKKKKGLPEKMLEFFDEESLRLVEERRRSLMHPPRNVSEECVRAMISC
ncbi:hypothetical protein ACHAWO_007137 [Cyclotella atomus]|uniref:CRAL-TRIO domain-containing protein n=1 Tax=Cyclotella atomus TaxID=382360 RepID=A0ABD3PRP3_9STRA